MKREGKVGCRLPDKKDSPSPSSRKNMAKHRLRRGHQHAHSVTKRRYDGAPISTRLCPVRKIEPESFRSSQHLKQMRCREHFEFHKQMDRASWSSSAKAAGCTAPRAASAPVLCSATGRGEWRMRAWLLHLPVAGAAGGKCFSSCDAAKVPHSA